MAAGLATVFALYFLQVSAHWTPSLVSGYFRAQNVYLIDAFLCTAKASFDLVDHSIRTANKRDYDELTRWRVARTLDTSLIVNGSFGIFLDFTCARNQKLLLNVEEAEWFRQNVHWLVWDVDERLPSTNLTLPVGTYSDVVIIRRHKLQRLIKLWRGFPVETIVAGHWNELSGQLYLLPTNGPIDLRGTHWKGSITFMQDIYDKNNVTSQMADVHFKPGSDISNRFYYSNIRLLGSLYNFKLDLKYSKIWGERLDNGTWTGMFGMLQRGEVELCVNPLLPFGQRVDIINPTLSLVPYWMAVVFRQPRALGTYKAMILELSLASWVSVLVLTVVGSVVFCAAQKYDPSDDSDGSWAMGIVQTVGVIANQGLSISPNGTPSRIVCVSLLFVGFILSTYYSTTTLTALLAPSSPVIRNVDELVHSKIPINFRNAAYITHVTVRRRVFPDQMLELMDKPKELKLWELDKGTLSILNGSAFVDEYFVLFQDINSRFKSDLICDLTVYRASYHSVVLTYIAKGSHFRELYMRGLLRIIEYGLVHKERQRWVSRCLQCSPVNLFIPVQMEAASVAFGIFSVGVLLSAAIFILEVLVADREPPRKKKWKKTLICDNSR